MSESECRFVSSRGILRSCDAHARRLCSELDRLAHSSFDFSQLELSYWSARIQSLPIREGLPLRYDDFLSSLPE